MRSVKIYVEKYFGKIFRLTWSYTSIRTITSTIWTINIVIFNEIYEKWSAIS